MIEVVKHSNHYALMYQGVRTVFNLVRLVQPEFKPMDREVPSPLDEIGNDHQR